MSRSASVWTDVRAHDNETTRDYRRGGWHVHPVEPRGSCRFARAWAGSILCGLAIAVAPAMPSVGAETTATEPLAEVNGEAITAKDLEGALGTRLSTLEEQIYNLRRQALEALIAQRLLDQEAAKRGIPVAALLDAEVTKKAAPVTEDEIEAFYQANKTHFRGDEATARQNVRALLQQRTVAARRALFVESLRSQGKVLVRLQRPPVVRMAVSIEGAPVRGAAGAPVTLVEFSDFHCPFCKRAQATLKQILERYPGKVRHAYRDFPIDSLHPQARRAAEAARCAQDQGKFWDYHDVLFASPPQAAADDLRRYAERVGLDVPTFERCVSAGTHSQSVQRDVDEGSRLGLNGTPAFFINGRALQGAQPLDAFVRVIEEELSRP
jgi:protein-disulfide isomerase